MDEDNFVDTVTRRKLEFLSDETRNGKGELNISGEKLVTDCHLTILEEKIPNIGMEFDSEEAAHRFYNAYAGIVGFGIRRQYRHTDSEKRIVDRSFCCASQGHRGKDKRDVNVKSHRPETRHGCGAMMKISALHGKKFKVVNFIGEHNGHDLVSPSKIHILRSHRNMTVVKSSQVDNIENSGITPKVGFQLMSRQAGGRENVGFIFQDYKNYLRSKRTLEMKQGDTRGVLEYLQQRQLEDSSFFYAIQVYEDDLISNIFWVDAQMKADYVYFGDVVCFDTTYKKNREGRPFALFVGVNHHKQTIVFGAALLYDETAATFMWLFDTYARAMSGKQPKTILTDQDVAMAKALAKQWPETSHRLCIWHIYQNAAIHLSSVFSHFTNFSKDFSSCVYDYEEEEEFLKAWQIMLDKYGLQTNDWLERMFKIKEKWALVYGRQSFCADMTTTQRSESMNSALKRYVSYKNSLVQFFHHFDRLVDERRYEELKADLRTSHSTPTASFPVEILKHAASVYTHEVFGLFQDELCKSYDSKIELCGEAGDTFEYKVMPFRRSYQHTVTYESSQVKVSCSCKKFEFSRILCSHALKIVSLKNIVRIPELYIKKRWTKKAKKKNTVEPQSSEMGVHSKSTDGKDERKMIRAQYQELCSLHTQLVTRAALTEETFMIAKNGLLKMTEEVDTSLENRTFVRPSLEHQLVVPKKLVSYSTKDALDEVANASNNIVIRGLKNKEKKPAKSGKRPRSGLEKSTRNKKAKHNVAPSSNPSLEHEIIMNSAQDLDNNSNGLSINTSVEPNSLLSLSQLSQEYRGNISNLNTIYPTEVSQFSQVQPFQSAQMFNPIVYQQHAITPLYSRQDHQNQISLQLLQQQLIGSQGFERFQSNNFTTQDGHWNANNGHGDVAKE